MRDIGFEPLALKYRPKRFSDFIGQQATRVVLEKMCREGKMDRPMVFAGVKGTHLLPLRGTLQERTQRLGILNAMIILLGWIILAYPIFLLMKAMAPKWDTSFCFGAFRPDLYGYTGMVITLIFWPILIPSSILIWIMEKSDPL